MKYRILPIALAALILTGTLHAQVPQLINYQGRIAVAGVNFEGPGQFKFALVNGVGTTTFWSNDGSSVLGGQPTASVPLTVAKGLYSVLLGDVASSMIPIPPSVFDHADVRLRIWFNDGTNGFQLLAPDQRIAAVGYAMTADSARIAQTVSDGALTLEKLDPALAAALSRLLPKPMEFVTVGNPGNAADPRVMTDGTSGYGAVAYAFQIGKYEVTNAQYAEFLNAVAASDPNGLYQPVSVGYGNGGIVREGPSASYSYSVKTGLREKPVVFVSWYSAIRFCNWLHNGKPNGAQGPVTTEDGAYTITGGTTVSARMPGAQYFLPSENEWYKAAYYDPVKVFGEFGGYWLYSTRLGTQPNSRNGSTSDANSANYYYDDGIANGYNGGFAVTNSTGLTPAQITLTDRGAFTLAASAYGTFDQGGNAAEWTEALINPLERVFRGGHWSSFNNHLQASYRDLFAPFGEFDYVGFRVARP